MSEFPTPEELEAMDGEALAALRIELQITKSDLQAQLAQRRLKQEETGEWDAGWHFRMQHVAALTRRRISQVQEVQRRRNAARKAANIAAREAQEAKVAEARASGLHLPKAQWKAEVLDAFTRVVEGAVPRALFDQWMEDASARVRDALAAKEDV